MRQSRTGFAFIYQEWFIYQEFLQKNTNKIKDSKNLFTTLSFTVKNCKWFIIR